MPWPSGPRLPVAEALVREMSISRTEFLRLLPLAAPGYRCDIAEHVVKLVRPERQVEIGLAAMDDLRIGALCLPRMRVALGFVGFDVQERCAFLGRFDRTYQRGGG